MQWTNEHLEYLKEWYGKKSNRILAEHFGVTEEAVKLKASRIGISQKRNTHGFIWTPEKIAMLKERYETDEIADLCRDIGAHMSTIRHKAVSLGLHSNVGRVRAGRESSENKTTLDIHYFDQWSSDMAYILGFLFADGSINKRGDTLIIGLACQDECVLDHIKQEMKVAKDIYRTEPYTDKKGYQHQSASWLYLGSRILIDQLQRLGLQKRKTYTNEPFPIVPVAMSSHFVRGYFDGDGTVFIHKDKRWPNSYTCHIGFVGSPKFVVGLRDILVNQTDLTSREPVLETKKTTVARIRWSAHTDLQKFYDFIYPPGYSFCLERKRKVLHDWLEAKRNRELET